MALNGAAAIHNLGIADTETLAEFLLYHLSGELRSRLMGELPVIYATLYPEVNEEILTEHVLKQIRYARADHPPKYHFTINR